MENGASPALANESNYVPLDLANFNDRPEVARFFLAQSGMLEDKNKDEGLNGAAASIEINDEGDAEDEGGKAAS